MNSPLHVYDPLEHASTNQCNVYVPTEHTHASTEHTHAKNGKCMFQRNRHMQQNRKRRLQRNIHIQKMCMFQRNIHIP